MKLVLDIENKKADFFIELIKSFDFVQVLKLVNDEKKSQQIQDLVEAFQDVRLHSEGKKKLKKAKDLLNEL